MIVRHLCLTMGALLLGSCAEVRIDTAPPSPSECLGAPCPSILLCNEEPSQRELECCGCLSESLRCSPEDERSILFCSDGCFEELPCGGMEFCVDSPEGADCINETEFDECDELAEFGFLALCGFEDLCNACGGCFECQTDETFGFCDVVFDLPTAITCEAMSTCWDATICDVQCIETDTGVSTSAQCAP